MMDPASEIEFIHSRQVNTTMGGAKGVFREIFGEGIKPLLSTLLVSAAAGAVIGGLILGGAALFGTEGAVGSILGAFGGHLGIAGFLGISAASGAALTTAMVGTKGYLDGRHAAMEQNQVLENAASLLKQELNTQGTAIANARLQEQVARKEGAATGYIQNILAAGKRASPIGHAQALMEERHQDGAGQKQL